jgi:hypothetical protein
MQLLLLAMQSKSGSIQMSERYSPEEKQSIACVTAAHKALKRLRFGGMSISPFWFSRA